MSVPPPSDTLGRAQSIQSSQSTSGNTTANALHNFKLLSALRSDDPTAVQPFLQDLPAKDVGPLLGMAVRVASAPVIQRILNSPSIADPNEPVAPGKSSTALHVASEIGRVDAVRLLLLHPQINDTIRDEQGRTALECASDSAVSSAIEDSRTTLQLQYLGQLAGYIGSPLNSLNESNSMFSFLEGPRTEILNLNALDEKSGTSLLHEAARRRDLRLVELAMKRGADAFVRDKKGKRVQEGEKSADERVKVFLRQFNNQENLVHSKSDGRPPELRGFLSKWVNYRSGWRTRYFVLENGILSYYRNREDENIACRGSIAMAVAKLQPSSDGSRFEVHSRVHSSVPKIIVKSSHRAEVARWIQTIKLNLEYYSQHEQTQPTKAASVRAQSFSSTGPSLSTIQTSLVPSLPPTENFLSSNLQQSTMALSPLSAAQPALRRTSSPARSTTETDGGDALSVFDTTDKDSIAGTAEHQTLSSGVPYEADFELALLNIKAQIDMTEQLVASLEGSSTSTTSTDLARVPSRQKAVKDALQQSLRTLSALLVQQKTMIQERERYYISRIHREVEARRLWEENMLTIAKQQAETDEQLNRAARDNEKKRKALRQARGVLAGLGGSSLPPMSPGLGSGLETPTRGSISDLDATLQTPASGAFSPAPSASISHMAEIQQAHQAVAAADTDSDDDDEDEFFDAIESKTIPNLLMHESIANPDKERAGTPQTGNMSDKQLTAPIPGSKKIVDLLARQSLSPYLHVRNKLPIDDDKRPSVSLWSILKSSVGKDLTKISFPVSFNECTSMLQRMAEDMEYDACLTVAAGEQDSLRRIAFVAAFAMSNYSSTIGRIAKPFNPLLSQSFEYAIPNRYRYISEQVSHHPPASACYCEAPLWKYYGEVDAQNKFQGRSFEIRPTGMAHAELVIPKDCVKDGSQYPDAGAEYGEGKVIEHYSWKKVTTNVSNFIMGNPIIDHYGDLVVTNHRTGETCTLTFKPRGWRGGNAFEIRGTVVDSSGHPAWDIAGRWDTQLIARRAGSSAPLEVNTQVGESQKEYILLWRNSEKPKEPFNLTPYAITLNDIPSGLERYLCPTDCRLRTDQRAFENAEYDRAQALKTANEEKQRYTRKLRAESKLPPHEARWFSATTDEDTQEKLWKPRRDEGGEVLFWSAREEAGKKGEWQGVDSIFATD